jgi:ATP-dependent DNA helicase
MFFLFPIKPLLPPLVIPLKYLDFFTFPSLSAGLGKTLQTISFLSTLRTKGMNGPFLVVGPLSTLPNWVAEIQRFAPSIPVLLYHGTPDERRDLRAARMPLPKGAKAKVPASFPIVVTSFEVAMKDRAALERYEWRYMVVDEGHRLKNKDCKLLRDLKMLGKEGRLLLTGTPLQNNLQELWSLLNFILPDVFANVDDFNEWFDFSGMIDGGGGGEGDDRQEGDQRGLIVKKLQQILRPFLLRRVKSDVLASLPPKKEIVLYCPMTAMQRKLSDGIKDGSFMKELHRLATESSAAGGGGAPPGARRSLNNVLMQLRKVANHPDLVNSQVRVREGLYI